MQLHQLQTIHKSKAKKRIGRGGKRGHYSGRGTKGQKSRAGARIRPAERDLIISLPKLRGVKNPAKMIKRERTVLNIKDLNVHFENGETVNRASLFAKDMIPNPKAPVKILGQGNLSKHLAIGNDIKLSKSAAIKLQSKPQATS